MSQTRSEVARSDSRSSSSLKKATPKRRLSTNCDTGRYVGIDSHVFEVGQKLGAGTFGSVWRASLTDEKMSITVALKEMIIGSHFSLDDALYEILVQKTVCDWLQAQGQKMSVPRYLAHEVHRRPSVSRPGKETTMVMFAMEEIPGMAMDRWMYNVETIEFKTMSVSGLRESGLKSLGGAVGTYSLDGALDVATNFLSQLAPVFSQLDKIAFHRDVSTHNILVNPANMDFTVIDFGMATDAVKWRQGGWKTGSIGGDVRHWTPSTWMLYLYGPSYLARHPVFVEQYERRIDYYAVGYLTLELLFNLLDKDTIKDTPFAEELQAVWDAWMDYWFYCMKVFQTVMTEGHGRLDEIRPRMQQMQVSSGILDRVKALVRKVQILIPKAPQMEKILCITLDMLCHSPQYEWGTICKVLRRSKSLKHERALKNSQRPQSDGVPMAQKNDVELTRENTFTETQNRKIQLQMPQGDRVLATESRAAQDKEKDIKTMRRNSMR